MEHRRRLERALSFFSPDSPGNPDDYALLYEDGWQSIRNHLRKKRCPDSDIEDITQAVFAIIYERRRSLTFTYLGQWYAYLQRAASNRYHDLPRPHQTLRGVDPIDERGEIVKKVEARLAREALLRHADNVWLGEEPALDADAKLLAAQYFYTDGLAASEVIPLISPRCKGKKPRSEEELLGWLSELSVLRRLAFASLYYSNESLTAILLGQPSATTEELNALLYSPSERLINGWRRQEVDVIRWRYRHGLPLAHIPMDVRGRLSSEEITALTARCQAEFPFVRMMTLLWTRLEGHPLRPEVLTKNLLWKRLVFQYHVYDELPQDDIRDRVSSPADVAGYRLRHVNAWVASRLRDELKSRLTEEETALA